MPDWKAAVRAAIAHLNLEPAREASIVEELSDHLSEKYKELLSSGVSEQEAYRSRIRRYEPAKAQGRTRSGIHKGTASHRAGA